MDLTLIIFLLFICLAIFSHPTVNMIVKQFFSSKTHKKNKEQTRCIHTTGDCRDCTHSLNCPMKNEYVVVVPKEDEYT